MKKTHWLSAFGCLLLLTAPLTIQAQEDTADESALQAEVDELIAITERLRRLDTINTVEIAYPSREETIDYLTNLYTTELPPEDVYRIEAFYIALGLLPEDTDLISIYLDLLGSQIAGFYDTETQLMNVLPLGSNAISDQFTFLEQTIFVHEYTHALQDQYFDLHGMIDEDESLTYQPDRSLALTSLVEGDASAVMQVYQTEAMETNPNLLFQLLAEGFASGSLLPPTDTPSILMRELTFPYETGLSFVTAVLGRGGVEALNETYANPPVTTEQIIHPQKYFSGEVGMEVNAPNLVDLYPDVTVLWDSTIGQFYLNEFLLTEVSSNTARRATVGWGGDRFQLVENADGAWIWTLTTAWDSGADFEEFADAATQWANERFGTEDQTDCWENDTQAVCIVVAGETVTIQSAPRLSDLETLTR